MDPSSKSRRRPTVSLTNGSIQKKKKLLSTAMQLFLSLFSLAQVVFQLHKKNVVSLIRRWAKESPFVKVVLDSALYQIIASKTFFFLPFFEMMFLFSFFLFLILFIYISSLGLESTRLNWIVSQLLLSRCSVLVDVLILSSSSSFRSLRLFGAEWRRASPSEVCWRVLRISLISSILELIHEYGRGVETVSADVR